MAKDESKAPEAPKAAPKQVMVYLLEKLEDGTFRVANSHECPQDEAELMIRQEQAKHPECPIGVLPVVWE